MHKSSIDKMRGFRKDFLGGREGDNLKILDLGSCDVNGSYKPIFDSPAWSYVGVDMAPGENVDIVLSDPYDWREVEPSSVDVVVSGQTFEHIELFWLTMLEIEKVLKPGGLCCILAPSGGYEHRYPVDCWRFYPDGFAALARFAGMEVLKVATQWEPEGYEDGSDDWRDSMLVGRKPSTEAAPEPGKERARSNNLSGQAGGENERLRTPGFNPLDYRGFLQQDPRRLSNVRSWHGHMPFAFMIMEMLRPDVFVELGTHKGDSYFAFCQAASALKLDTKCFAVDTWKGEEHAGFYGEDVYNELKLYHDPQYGRFSTLVRATFDTALGGFEDGGVDLLHIDGLHTYEAVRHDFESWLPKMSERGVVLFHDIKVRERGFGVWKLWDEVKGRYPSFEFTHSYGLGVLGVGGGLPDAARDFFRMTGEQAAGASRLFELLGERITVPEQVRMEYERVVAEKDRQVAQKDKLLAEKDLVIAERERRIEDILNSASWRVTAPLRGVAGLVKRQKTGE